MFILKREIEEKRSYGYRTVSVRVYIIHIRSLIDSLRKQEMTLILKRLLVVLVTSNVVAAFSTKSIVPVSRSHIVHITERVSCSMFADRRSFLTKSIVASQCISFPAVLSYPAFAEATSSVSNAKITSKIFITLKGLPSDESNTDPSSESTIVIGLFGDDAPGPVSILEKLVSSNGYPALCKPKEIRTLQREQLEANKVYSSCLETQDTKGVNYDLSTVWRVEKDKRIDLGAVSGKFVAREFPIFEGRNEFKHDTEGVVSVRRGNDGGFGFTIYPGSTGTTNPELDEENIVVGMVIEGVDVVRRLNNIPVVQSALSGGQGKRSSPTRACRYGGSEAFCNELKPLKKILIYKTDSP
jgi:cyclophilin family peptidyl-prolyl cis-trans isomerase